MVELSSLKTVILAGGYGIRLKPIVFDRPKPMASVNGKPFLEYLMNFLKNRGITEIILCIHYMAETFVQYFGNGSEFGFSITYSVEEAPLGTAGAIKRVEDHLSSTFLVLNGDTFLDVDHQKMLKFHKDKNGLGTLALTKMKNPSRYGVVNVAEDWRLTGLSEKAPISEGYINAGVYIFEPEILDYIPRNSKVSLERELLPSVLSKERLYGFLAEGYFIDIGIPNDYYRFQREVSTVLK